MQVYKDLDCNLIFGDMQFTSIPLLQPVYMQFLYL